MTTTLVVGATGAVGSMVVDELSEAGRPVRAFVRPGSDHGRFDDGVELAFGDLRDRRSVEAALEGVSAVVATANAVAPRLDEDTFEAVEGEGYATLIEACEAADIDRFVFLSVPVSPFDDEVPTLRYKRLNESRLFERDLPYTVVRAAPFMDDWFALLGSSIPTRGREAPAAVDRPFWFSRLYRRATGNLIEDRGVALVPGDGNTPHAFVTEADVARFLVACIDHPDAENAILEFGGPEHLTFEAVVDIFESVLGRPVRRVHLPAAVARAQQRLLTPMSPAAGNVMGLMRLAAGVPSDYAPAETDHIFPGERTTVREFLTERAAAVGHPEADAPRPDSAPTP